MSDNSMPESSKRQKQSSALQPVKVSPEIMKAIQRGFSKLNWGAGNTSSNLKKSEGRQVSASLISKPDKSADDLKKKLDAEGLTMDDLQKLKELNQ